MTLIPVGQAQQRHELRLQIGRKSGIRLRGHLHRIEPRARSKKTVPFCRFDADADSLPAYP
jgi:hypothetical protein